MNQKKVKAIRKSIMYDVTAERKYKENPKTGTIHAPLDRKRYQKLKKENI